jgi:hypothetical protein
MEYYDTYFKLKPPASPNEVEESFYLEFLFAKMRLCFRSNHELDKNKTPFGPVMLGSQYHIDYEGFARDMELGGDVFTLECEGKIHVFYAHI